MIHHVVGAGFQRRFDQRVLVGSRREQKLAAMPEQECDRAVGSEVATVLGECVAHVVDRADAVVGQAIYEDRGAVDAVASVADLPAVAAPDPTRAPVRGPSPGAAPVAGVPAPAPLLSRG